MSNMQYMKNQLRRQYTADVVQSSDGGGGDEFADCIGPAWNLAAWDRFRARYGEDPYSATQLPPGIEDAPERIFHRMGMRPPWMTRGR